MILYPGRALRSRPAPITRVARRSRVVLVVPWRAAHALHSETRSKTGSRDTPTSSTRHRSITLDEDETPNRCLSGSKPSRPLLGGPSGGEREHCGRDGKAIWCPVFPSLALRVPVAGRSSPVFLSAGAPIPAVPVCRAWSVPRCGPVPVPVAACRPRRAATHPSCHRRASSTQDAPPLQSPPRPGLFSVGDGAGDSHPRNRRSDQWRPMSHT